MASHETSVKRQTEINSSQSRITAEPTESIDWDDSVDENQPISLNLTENALKVLEKRYLIKDENSNPAETPEDMFHRVARNIAQADLKYTPEQGTEKTEAEFYRLMTSLDFMPNSPTLMNAGRRLQQLSACFVLPIDDSMESIFDAVRNTALVHKSGGGTGFSFSRLRPKNDIVSTTYGLSSGPISFMKVFDSATHAVNQGGFRRGANMGIMRVDHPDIMEFIRCKSNQAEITNFNISVGITEKFMTAVENDTEYNLYNPRTKDNTSTLKAREVFDTIVNMAWKNGEPGIVFLDRINKENPTPHIGEIESTNPCGEQPLLPYEACNLGSINLSKFVKDKRVDFERLRQVTHAAVHFLDNVIDMSKFPLPEISKMVHGNRKIGLGVMGFADLLFNLKVSYNSEKALEIGEKVMGFINTEAREKSRMLARERGAFPNFKGSVYDEQGEPEQRNATLTTIAPTGSISIIAGCSSGIEPLFSVAFTRNVMDGNKLTEVHPDFKKIAIEKGFYSEKLMDLIAEKGTLKGLEEIPEDIRKVFVCAHDVSPEWHIRMQAAFQRNTDNAVSKTVNFCRDATPEDVEEVYMLAYKEGCKGVTIYRDGSRDNQVLSLNNQEKAKETAKSKIVKRERPKKIKGETIKMETGCGSLYVTVNYDKQGPFELFNTMGKAGGCPSSQCEAIGRLASLAWRVGIDTSDIIKSLRGISCHRPMGFGDQKCLSCADAIAKAIQVATDPDNRELAVEPTAGEACPECGGIIEHEGGCMVCHDCGYSECA